MFGMYMYMYLYPSQRCHEIMQVVIVSIDRQFTHNHIFQKL
jgi:hypothetical protein